MVLLFLGFFWSLVDISNFLVMATGPGDEDRPSSFTVVVKTMFGKHFELAVSNSDTIKSVKQKITNKLNIPEEGFTLLHNTRFVELRLCFIRISRNLACIILYYILVIHIIIQCDDLGPKPRSLSLVIFHIVNCNTGM